MVVKVIFYTFVLFCWMVPFQTVKCLPPFKQILFKQAKIRDTRLLPVAFALLTRKVDNYYFFSVACHDTHLSQHQNDSDLLVRIDNVCLMLIFKFF
jgi:hypothetical protein